MINFPIVAFDTKKLIFMVVNEITENNRIRNNISPKMTGSVTIYYQDIVIDVILPSILNIYPITVSFLHITKRLIL